MFVRRARGVERLASLVHKINVTPLAALMPDVYPAHFGADTGMGHFEPGRITDPAASPIPQGKQRSSAPISLLLDERSENEMRIPVGEAH